MPLTKDIDEDECKLFLRVTGDSLSSTESLKAILADLDLALGELDQEMSSSDHYYFQICLDVAGVAPKVGAFSPYDVDDSDDPWIAFCPDFWTRAMADPEVRPGVEEFVARFQGILRKHSAEAISPPSEHDEVQLGEPLLAHLAMSDRGFVPYYIGFLRLWDMDHEVAISEAVDEIMSHHGDCDAVEALLSHCLIEDDHGSEATGMYLRTFQNLRPDAANTVLFQRYLINLYRNHLGLVAEECRRYQNRLKSAEPGADVVMPNCAYRPQFDAGSAFGETERQVISTLQNAHLP